MTDSEIEPLILHNRHTGERLQLTRFEDEAGEWLELKGSLPPRSEGPPLHIHKYEDEGGRVMSGTISAILNGRTLRVGAGGQLKLPKGQPHRWWNADDQQLVFEGYARPVIDLDRQLQALFDVVNAAPAGRPSLFYLAQALHRHRRTQLALIMPRPVQAILFPIVIMIGHLLGKYRGGDWPGSPARCKGAPLLRAVRGTP